MSSSSSSSTYDPWSSDDDSDLEFLNSDVFGSSDSEDEDILPFNYNAIQDIILTLCDQFNVRVTMSDDLTDLVIISESSILADSLLGKFYGSPLFGIALGEDCTDISLRAAWTHLKSRLHDVVVVTYDYLVLIGVSDYQAAMACLNADYERASHLIEYITHIATTLLNEAIADIISRTYY